MSLIRRVQNDEAQLYKQLRLAALADSPHAFCATLAEALLRSNESWQEQTSSSASESDRATFLAFKDNSPIGLAAIYRNIEFPNTGDLIQVWLHPAHRGTGIAQSLINTLLVWARDNSFENIQTEVLNSNEGLLPFYENLGFLKIGKSSNSHILELSLEGSLP